MTYANVVSTLCLFILLGGGAWAAAKINSGDVKDNSLKSGDVKDNSLKSIDLKDEKGVKDVDVVPDSLTGAAVNESTLQGVDATSLGGLQVRKINYNVSIDDAAPYASILSFGGLEITAACRSFGDGLDVKATTTTNDLATLYGTSASGLPDDTDGFLRRPFSSTDPPVDIDNEFTDNLRTVGTLHYQAPDGGVVVVQLMLVEDDEIDNCFISGIAIGA